MHRETAFSGNFVRFIGCHRMVDEALCAKFVNYSIILKNLLEYNNLLKGN
jgi:hypothetical protein